eukprot:GHVU01108489.1.p5 GENE.GHVU01108489.1~~GHVU01108489.1.p5  ORF type:complete len:120 (-),score=10.70 GHVU01108489.1:57-416(-)
MSSLGSGLFMTRFLNRVTTSSRLSLLSGRFANSLALASPLHSLLAAPPASQDGPDAERALAGAGRSFKHSTDDSGYIHSTYSYPCAHTQCRDVDIDRDTDAHAQAYIYTHTHARTHTHT